LVISEVTITAMAALEVTRVVTLIRSIRLLSANLYHKSKVLGRRGSQAGMKRQSLLLRREAQLQSLVVVPEVGDVEAQEGARDGIDIGLEEVR
jgi:hypothetical protein